jgi:hypothetical protein
LHPSAGSAGGLAVVFATSFGKGSDHDALELASAGAIVLAVDPRGIGESYQSPPRSGYSQAYQLASRAILLGRNLVEMQSSDLLSAARYLQSRPEAAERKLAFYAKGSLGPAALFAAVLDQSVSEVILERSIVSYSDVVAASIHENLNNIIAPGILRHLDLTDVMRLLQGRRLTLVSPLQPNGRPMLDSEIRQSLGSAVSIPRLVIRGEGWDIKRTLPEMIAGRP